MVVKKNVEFNYLNFIKIKKFRKLALKKKKTKFKRNRLIKKQLRFKHKNLRLKLIQKRYILNKLVNLFNKKGKKVKAYHILLNIFLRIRIITKKSPFFFILTAIKKLKPYVKVVKIRKAGKIYEVPVPLNKKKQLFLIFKWIILSIKNKNNFIKAFSSEILDIYFKKGNSLKFKKDFIKKAYDNRAITHYRWY